jgi:hypothetical protein
LFAQSNQPVTRAQVRAKIVQLEKAGYDPSSAPIDYPAGLEAAEARVAAKTGAIHVASKANRSSGA